MSSFYVSSDPHRAHFCLIGRVRHRGQSFKVLAFVIDGRAQFRVATNDLARLEMTTPVGFEATADTKVVFRGGGYVIRIFESLAQALRLKVAPADRPIIWTKDVLVKKGLMPLPRTRLGIQLAFYVVRIFRGKRREDVLEVELSYEGEAYREGSTVRLRTGLHAGMRIAHGARLFARYRGLLGDPPGITRLSVARVTDNGRHEAIGLYTPGWTGQSALRLTDIPLVRDPRTQLDRSLGRWVVSSRTRRALLVEDMSP